MKKLMSMLLAVTLIAVCAIGLVACDETRILTPTMRSIDLSSVEYLPIVYGFGYFYPPNDDGIQYIRVKSNCPHHNLDKYFGVTEFTEEIECLTEMEIVYETEEFRITTFHRKNGIEWHSGVFRDPGLIEGKDYYLIKGLWVFQEIYEGMEKVILSAISVETPP